MQATTSSRSALNLIRVFHAACNSAATNTNAVASTAYSLCCLHDPCRSELAREKRQGNAFKQQARVFVHVHREQARSYRESAQRIDSPYVSDCLYCKRPRRTQLRTD